MNDYINKNESRGKNTEDIVRKPFKACLDVGLTRITTGNRVFGSMKGCVDAGLNIPHSVKRFPGFKKIKGKKSGEYDAEVHTSRILARHVDEYWGDLEENNPEKAKKHFTQWQNCLDKTGCETIPDVIEKVISGIKKDPSRKVTKKAKQTYKREGSNIVCSSGKKWNRNKKLTNEQRKQNVRDKIKDATEK